MKNASKKKTNKKKNNNTNKTTSGKSTVPFASLSSKTQAKKETYVYRGKKNQTKFPEFIELCKPTQGELKVLLPQKLLEAGYTDVVKGDGYIYAKGTVPVLLTAHMDTVHNLPVIDFYEYVDEKGNHIISSPQGIGGDDRCGIYMILEIIKEHKCSVLFCEDEESGGIGSSKFCKTDLIYELADLRYLIELDRANGKDAVFYDCDNEDFTEFIEKNTGYREAWGSFSDISTLAPKCGVAAVNLSCGYYNAHTVKEEVKVEEMLNTIEVVKKLLTVECEQFEYIEAKYNYNYGYGYGYGHNYGYSYSGGYKRYYGKWSDWDNEDDETIVLFVQFYDGYTYKEEQKRYYAKTEEEAWFKFFKDNPDTCWNLVLDYDIDRF